MGRKSRTRPAIGYALACGMCTPALPNPMPANVAAMAMSARAWASSPRRTAVRNDVASSRMARSDHMSETGFEPQYGTRCSGRFRS